MLPLLGHRGVSLADQIDASLQAVAVDDDLNAVAVAHLADRTARQGLRPDVADARPVETPEKRASVSTATCLPKLRCFSADVI